MPGSYDSEGSSSPSLIPSLRNFRFQKSKAKHNIVSPLAGPRPNIANPLISPPVRKSFPGLGNKISVTNTSNKTPVTNTPNKIPVINTSEITIIPETPKSQIQLKTYSSPRQVQNGNVTPLSRVNQIYHAARMKKYSTTSKTSNASPCTSAAKTVNQVNNNSNGKNDGKRQVMDEYEVFCEKEQNLKELLRLFPGADIMEAQDILVNCQWNLKVAIDTAKKKPLRTTRRKSDFLYSDTFVNKGVVYSSEMSDNQLCRTNQKVVGAVNNQRFTTSTPNHRTSSVTEEIILDDSDDSTNDADARKNNSIGNSVNSNHLSLNVFRHQSKQIMKSPSVNSQVSEPVQRKRKRIRLPSSDSDDDAPVVLSTSNSEQSNDSMSIINRQSFISAKFGQNCEVTMTPVKPSTSLLAQDNNSLSVSTPKRTYSKTNTVNSNIELSTSSNVECVVNTDISMQEDLNKADTSKPKNIRKKKKRKLESDDEYDEEYNSNEDVYDSDDSTSGENLTPARSNVLNFFQEASSDELTTIPGCSKKKAEVIIKYRPFAGWTDLVQKLDSEKFLSTDFLNGAKKVLDMRAAVSRLMTRCQKIALNMEDLVENLKENKESSSGYVDKQPELLNDKMHLAPYQMLGLNWLLLMHNQEVNGILADEMGLGKTVQAIAFLAFLKEQSVSGPHLIVVPSSTLDNWQNELKTWWPSVSILCYHGSLESRRLLRLDILNEEVEEFDVMVTTYNMVASNAEDRAFFKRLEFYYVIFDEAHMLKNMASQRYQNLMRIKASRRLLLTGTPLQNNLVELMSLLIFTMPNMFYGKTDHVRQMFSSVCKSDDGKTTYEKERIEHAKRIMKPFLLRRLKSEVLQDLPRKHEEIRMCPMTEEQAKQYAELVKTLSAEVQSNKEKDICTSGCSMMMQLRKAANHPLLLKYHYDDDKLLKMAELMIKEPTHTDANVDLIFEDMSVMSDFELHKLCKMYQGLKEFRLPDEKILNSGKFAVLDELMPKMIKEEHRILLFSQFTMVLDIIEEYMKIRKHKYLRLDGQIPVAERQQLIDEFNKNANIPVFLLSTRAGGLGINLTAADVVLIHDIDFNPYNDKQAEDRCHRVGQLKDVTVIRMISENTFEEGMLQRAKEKLKLERDVTEKDGDEENDTVSVAKLLRDALGLSNSKTSKT